MIKKYFSLNQKKKAKYKGAFKMTAKEIIEQLKNIDENKQFAILSSDNIQVIKIASIEDTETQAYFKMSD